MHQLELDLYPPWTVRGCLETYIAAVKHKITPDTLRDYEDRAAWLWGAKVLGAATPITDVTFRVVEELTLTWGPLGLNRIRFVTIRKRLRLLKAAMEYALERGHDCRIFKMPPQIHDDGQRGQDFYTVPEFGRFADQLPAGAHRRFFELGFWTGMHTANLRNCKRWQLEPEFVWKVGRQIVARGRWWRLNQKNRRSKGCWVPMEPEFREIVLRWLKENPHWSEDSNVVGRTWNHSKVAREAARAAGLPYVTPNKGLRRSFATMIASRGQEAEEIRQSLGHEGQVVVKRKDPKSAPVVETHRPTTATSHYLRPSPELFANGAQRRRKTG